MILGRIVLAAVWIVCLIAALLLVPRARVREAVLVFLSSQFLTWISSLLLVENNFIANPVREFPQATGGNFTNNYVLFPLITAIFYLYYPEKGSLLNKAAYQALFVSASCLYVYSLTLFTQLVRYQHFNIWLNAAVFLAGMNLSRMYGRWYFQKAKRQEDDGR